LGRSVWGGPNSPGKGSVGGVGRRETYPTIGKIKTAQKKKCKKENRECKKKLENHIVETTGRKRTIKSKRIMGRRNYRAGTDYTSPTLQGRSTKSEKDKYGGVELKNFDCVEKPMGTRGGAVCFPKFVKKSA